MVDIHKPSDPPKGCARCGKPLSQDAPQGLCAACLLLAGAETLTGSVGDAPTLWGGDPPGNEEGPRLIGGQIWGSYRIGRLLGRGGMGEVYEAEHLKTGRRLALKVLRSRLQNTEERARFLREGQLAASVSHPHTVYIFGSEEISGTPVISMELAPGGTLKDRVASRGPLAPREAVDAILDIIGGLDAAQSAGILHRDIKPSNCFLDSEGAVKVGDFGLSISTLARDVYQDVSASGFQGTPQFAAPEQLRGEPLDVRADIYAVGATLYYLLTGKPPFDARNLRDLLARASTEPPQSPRLQRAEIPSGLAVVVLECLAKSPSQRPASYAALAESLRPYSSAGHVPATMGIRFLAGVIDSVIISLTSVVLTWLMKAPTGPVASAENGVMTLLLLLAYFVIEGLWYATPGKRFLGLRVVSVDGGVASWGRIACRHAIFDAPNLLFLIPIPIVGIAAYNAFVLTHAAFATTVTLVGLALYGALFLTARRHNGWAAVHDLLSGTRLVVRTTSQQRLSYGTAGMAKMAESNSSVKLEYGPFKVVSDAGITDDGRLLVGFDTALRRRVWIHTLPPGSPMIAAARRDASRPGRLHWLTGRRSPEENWDAFESPDGEPFLSERNSTRWSTMKMWLFDLANEFQAAVREGSLPKLGLDRIWVRNDGRLVLLEFPAAAIAVAAPDLTPVQLLSAVAEHAMSRNVNAPGSVPLRARSLIARWSGPGAQTFEQANAALRELSSTLDRVSKWRRAVPMALMICPFLFIALSALIVLPGASEKEEILYLLESLNGKYPAVETRLTDPDYRAAFERYLVGRHGVLLRDDRFWNDALSQTIGLPALRGIAAEVVTRYSSVSDDEVSRAEAKISAELAYARPQAGPYDDLNIAALFASMLVLILIVWCLISAAIMPGGLTMRMLGLAVVTRDGSEVGRVRSVVRAVTAWSPTISVFALLLMLGRFGTGQAPVLTPELLGLCLALVLPIIGAVWTIAHPARGLHDRVMGTWVVPR